MSNPQGGFMQLPQVNLDASLLPNTGVDVDQFGNDVMNQFNNLGNFGDLSLSTSNPTQGTSFMDGFFTNGQGGQGWGVPALQTFTGLANTFMGYQQLREGKRQNRIANQQWKAQFDIQKAEYDRQVRERDARVAANQARANSAGG